MAGIIESFKSDHIPHITSFKSFDFKVLKALESKTTEAHTFFFLFLCNGMTSEFRSCMIGFFLFPACVFDKS